MSAAFVERSLPDLFEQVRSITNGDLVFMNPSRTMIAGLVEWGVRLEDNPHVQLLAEEWTLKYTLRQCPVASRSAHLIEAEQLDLRYVSDPPKTAVITDGEHSIALIEAGQHMGALVTTEQPFVEDLHQRYLDMFAQAEGITIHTPPISVIVETLAEHLGDDRREDFEAFVDAVDGTSASLDEVMIALLIAAKNHDLLYDISKWGEDIGLASKATFSRKKSELEDAGLIDTDKEYIDVGRPRLRLKFTDDRLDGASIDTIVDQVTDALS